MRRKISKQAKKSLDSFWYLDDRSGFQTHSTMMIIDEDNLVLSPLTYDPTHPSDYEYPINDQPRVFPFYRPEPEGVNVSDQDTWSTIEEEWQDIEDEWDNL